MSRDESCSRVTMDMITWTRTYIQNRWKGIIVTCRIRIVSSIYISLHGQYTVERCALCSAFILYIWYAS